MRLITDSAADLTPDEIAEHDIRIVPLYINFPDGEIAASDITPDAFYEKLQAIVPKVPTTSQPAVGDFMNLYEPAAEDGEPVLSIHVSSGLSGTVKTAGLAARQLAEKAVTVIDTLTLSAGQRFQVLAAARALKKGWSIEQISHRLDEIRAQTEAVYTLETLEYLQRGGRIGRVQALAGSLLSIKPIIHVDRNDGKYSTLGRARSISQSIGQITQHLAGMYGDEPVWVTVLHGQYADKAAALEEQLRARLKIGHLDTVRISPVLGVHTGPGIVGAGVVPMRLMADL